MPVTHVRPNDHVHLQSIASLFNSTPKIVTLTGAGISTNAGIPMSRIASRASPTRTHRFIRNLRDAGRLVRHYTQNIDCLEEKVGMSTDLREGPENRWDEGGRDEKTLSGREPLCPGCAEVSETRVTSGKRATAVGTLRPDIVLYDEEDLRAESINAIIQYDLSRRPDSFSL
ncbi:hypothetical protein CPLU01_15280 [Colletotrichum plurivorum]|uniref:Deacetylase sirtuin-type domain-containing protein n=1 Tax=Colletotrichum plurivorum TaxID=2175906 RepID=A0A8H6JCJ1_9PEZI|nr:hypothetical protein CPLU01_15280 [Colletotrichum plurivorum]